MLLLAAPGQAATYYVSSAGLDTRAGTSPSTAWRSIGRVNAHVFAPGDRILFEGGRTFSGTLYFDRADAGTATAPVVVSSYGSGRATIYSQYGRGILGYNTAGFRISNLFIVGGGRDVNTHSGILFYTDLPGDVLLDTIQIEYVDAVRFGDYGIEIGSHAGRSGFRNVRVRYVVASENGLGGIFTYAQQRAVHRNVYVGYSSAFQNWGFAGLPYNSGNGITLSGVDGGMVERSVAHSNGQRSTAGNGPVGIWAFDSNGVIIQFCESFDNKTGNTKDGGGFHLDNSTSNSILQYNYSHGNAGAGYMLAHKWSTDVHSGNVVRWNISQNDARRNNFAGIHLWGRIRNASIYNNVVYMTYATSAARAFEARNNSIEGNDLENVTVRNNIFQTTGGVPLLAFTASVMDTARGVFVQGNAYWPSSGAFRILWRGVTYTSLSAFRSATGQERVNGVNAGLSLDPLLMAPGAGSTFNNASMLEGLWQYRLKAASPLIDAGLRLSAFGTSIGPRDYFGGASAALSASDIGAHEWAGDCNWTITPASASVSAAGGSGSISVYVSQDSCGWATLPSASWLSGDPKADSGPGTVTFRVLANPGAARTGTLKIGNRIFTVSQAGR